MIVNVLPAARRDIRRAYEHLSREDMTAANRLLQIIDKIIDLLERNANVGRYSKTPGVREWSVPNWPYVIPYRVTETSVEILRVWHTAKNQPDHW